MLDPGEFSPPIYWLHVTVGLGAIALVATAILAAKGSQLHRRAGLGFAIVMATAALTAFALMGDTVAPPIVISSAGTLYGLGLGIAAMRPTSAAWQVVSFVGIFLASAIALLCAVSLTMFLTSSEPPPPPIIFVSLATGIIFAALAIADVRYLRSAEKSRNRRYRRHALRMSLVAAEVVRAPLMSLGPQIAGDATLPIYFFGSFLLVPVIYLLAMPDWVKSDRDPPGGLAVSG